MPITEIVSSTDAYLALAGRLSLDVVGLGVLVGAIYYPAYRRPALILTFVAVNLVVFVVAAMLNRVNVTLAAAFGLFAVFSMLRYRTDGISARDMTYLLVAMAVGLVTAVGGASWGELLLILSVLIGATALLETPWLNPREIAQPVLYERFDLLHLSRRAELLADLRARTGLPVHRVDVTEIDFVRDAARITLYYRLQ